MKLSVVILNYNVRYFLELCIKSVQAALSDLEAEIIVVDNNSSDDSCAMVKLLFPEVILIQNKENCGFSKGNNIGVARAKGEYLCILNPDTVVAEDTFLKILHYVKDIPKLGILGCQLIDGRGRFLPESKRNIPTPKVSIKKILGFSNSYYANHLSPSDIGEVEVLVGAFMFLKNTIFIELRGFDVDYFMYGEDVDFSYKVLKAGYQNLYYGETAILHFKGESTLKDKVYAQRFYGAMQIFYNKHFKSNVIFDLLIWFGIRFSRVFLKIPNPTNVKVVSTVLFTHALEFEFKFPFESKKINNFAMVTPGSQVIFDANSLNYRTIIKHMASSASNNDLTFRILPKYARFIIGSDSSQQRGEVVLLLKFK